MNSLKVLDVTLRDGGCVNDFNFGQNYMEKILKAQEASGVDVIEVGYLDEVYGTQSGRTQFINEKVIKQSFLKNKKDGTSYVAMVDFGKFDVEKLETRTPDGIDGIRIAFHKKDCMKISSVVKTIIQKGYECYIQPMVTLRYSDAELIAFIDLVNREMDAAAGFYIVDSFGQMRPNDMSRILNLVDHNLSRHMTLGFHSHNNLQMAYSNAITMLQFPTNRNLMIDCSIMGMGKGAGNLNAELLMEHLNLFYGKNYQIAPLLEVIDKVINPLHAEFYWGYSPEYYLSATNQCTPKYASFFYDKHMLPIDQVSELLSLIDCEKKISFDKEYAEELYCKYNANKSVDDRICVEALKKEFKGKRAILLAPGKSVVAILSELETNIKSENDICIGMNTLFDINDYILTTRKEVYDQAVEQGRNVIVCSNISTGGRGNVRILNYQNWIEREEEIQDSSAIIALNLLEQCGVRVVMLAGFDGFSGDINENYYHEGLRHPMNSRQADKQNKYFKKFIESKRKNGLEIEFLTHSKYQ